MIYALAGGLVLGVLLTWLVHRDELKYLRTELRVAQAQIAHAVIHQQAVIPPRTEEVEPLEPLSGALKEVIGQWEGAESQAVEEYKIRGYIAEGWGEAAILRQYGVKT